MKPFFTNGHEKSATGKPETLIAEDQHLSIYIANVILATSRLGSDRTKS